MRDERAVISPQARLHDSVQVDPYAVIGAEVEIGEGGRIGAHAVIEGPTTIGPRTRIYPFAAIGGDPQDKKFDDDEDSRLEIGADNTIREYCTINRGTSGGGGVTRIGDGNWIMAYVHIAHDCLVGDHTVMANNTTLAGHVTVDDYAVLGGFTKVHQFCRIGCHAFTAMDCGLSRDVPPYVMAAGHLGEPRGVNSEGLKRRGFTAEQVRNIRNAFKVLYRSELRLEQALEQFDAVVGEQPELQPLVDFLRDTQRSIIR
ncbi:MAG: acyl-ACP--UDP-N-acetylglucosamine O-acyltransferase [Pseudomonadota bacterium]